MMDDEQIKKLDAERKKKSHEKKLPGDETGMKI